MKYLGVLFLNIYLIGLLLMSGCGNAEIGANMEDCGFSGIPQAPEGWEITKLNDNAFEGSPYDFHMVSSDIGFVIMSAHLTADPEILKTTDGGTTWSSVFTTSIYRRPREIFFTTNEIGFVSLGYEGNGNLLRTLDGGENWDKIELGNLNGYFRNIQSSEMGNLFAIHFKDNDNSQLVKSIDNGLTWSIILDSNLLNSRETDLNMKLFKDRIYISGKNGNLVIADLEGQFIESLNVGDETIKNIVVLDEDNISISTHNKLLKTENRGANWSVIHEGDSDLIDFGSKEMLLAIINKSCCFDYDVCYSNDAISIFNDDIGVWTEGETIQSSLSYVNSVVKISESNYIFLAVRSIYELKRN